LQRVPHVYDVRPRQGHHLVVIVPVQLKDLSTAELMNFVYVLYGQIASKQDDGSIFLAFVPIIASLNPGLLDKLSINFHDNGDINGKTVR